MRTPERKIDRMLLESNHWERPKVIRTKLEKYRSIICNLHFLRSQSTCSIKKFLASMGVKTSTAAISNFIRTRFPIEIREQEKVRVAKQLQMLTEGTENDSQKSNSIASPQAGKTAKQKARKNQGEKRSPCN